MPWGRGDLYTLVIGLFVFALACGLHRKSIHKAHVEGHNSAAILTELMGISLSLGPLLMILADPIIKECPYFRVDLLDIVIGQSRITLWFAAFIACLNTGMSLIRTRDTEGAPVTSASTPPIPGSQGGLAPHP